MKVCQRNQDTAQHLFTSEDDDGKRFAPQILHMEAVVVMEDWLVQNFDNMAQVLQLHTLSADDKAAISNGVQAALSPACS